MTVTTVQRLADDVRALAAHRGGRTIIGIAGAPGAGKSTLAEALVDAVVGAALVPMDGFHLSQRMLTSLGRADRKGAPDTFDIDGLVNLLARIRAEQAPVYFPVFDRSIEEPIAAGGVAAPEHQIVIVEGNYLLLDGPWRRIRELLDETWFLELADATRRERLVARHMRFGRSESEARAWVAEVDEPNAQRIKATLADADRVIALEAGG
ncbi:MAG: nucleoside/nucleotide kinase family protein [Microbacterium sp.]